MVRAAEALNDTASTAIHEPASSVPKLRPPTAYIQHWVSARMARTTHEIGLCVTVSGTHFLSHSRSRRELRSLGYGTA